MIRAHSGRSYRMPGAGVLHVNPWFVKLPSLQEEHILESNMRAPRGIEFIH